MAFFSLEEAAARYNEYRPKVHDVIKTWLEEAGCNNDFSRGLDVACGTGDSTLPLMALCDEVIGIDISEAMLKYANEKSISTALMSYQHAFELGKFDLISTCMAFHWFDLEEAIEAYKAASQNGAVWLIYNFSFGGSDSSEAFNWWLINYYFKHYPTPHRNSQVANIQYEQGITKLADGKGTLPISMSVERLIKYLTTQSNVEVQVKAGKAYEEIERELMEQITPFGLNSHFSYKYTYEIYRYDSHDL